MPLMFGIVPTAPSFLQGWVTQLRQGETLNLFTDEVRTPLNGEDAAKGIFLGLNQMSGILHLGGPESLSRYDIGMQLAEALGVSPDQLSQALRQDVSMAAPRPRDLTMSYELAASYGYAPAPIRQKFLEYFG